MSTNSATEPAVQPVAETDAEHRAAWARRQAVDAVANGRAVIACKERELADARRRLAVAESELVAARMAAAGL